MKLRLPKHPLVRQLLGALAGTLVAFVVYETYEIAAPRLLALLPSSTATVEAVAPGTFTEQDRAARQDRIVQYAQRLLEKGNVSR